MSRFTLISHPFFSSYSLGFILLSALLLVNCSHKIVVKDPDSIVIKNHGSRPITKLVIKPCNKPAEDFKEMAQGIKPGATKFILLYPGCFDADALDENGEIMATQYKVRIPPQLQWHIY
ncbi:MAG: hypothetical protein R3B83_06210 [Nitrospirales bacterium]|nr:hypothetical protein [Nitrospirales bacterium]